ncbi:MAG: asparagine synthase (glutamine-hydrolyzing) [Roseimicrobium sp.]
MGARIATHMCGFIGWFQAKGHVDMDRRRQLTAALKRITHRGPDDSLEASGGDWWMGFRRLSILDLSNAGRQPMRFQGSRYTLTFNGEIYNYRELREAIMPGANLISTGDTAVLGSLLAAHPVEEVLAELRGMFAFAWWDAQTRSLVAARDHFGIKPLYYAHCGDGTLMLSSELRVIRFLLGDEARLAQPALAQFLRWGAVQAPETMFDGVRCLPPGHLLKWRGGDLRVERWFKPQWPGKSAWLTGREAKAEVREVITDSVRAHLVSDVPVGVFLSGGLDSTLMAALMRQQGMENLQAFSIGYEENAGVPDESDAAERTASFLGCQFTRERLTSQSLFDKLDLFLSSLDQPTGDALNTWLVSQVAAQRVKVTLSGLGADEWFGGYNYHRMLAFAQQLSVGGGALRNVVAPLVKGMGSILPAGLLAHRAWKTLQFSSGAAGRDVAEMHAFAREIFAAKDIAALLGCGPEEVTAMTFGNSLRQELVHALSQRAPDSWLHELLLLETETYLSNTLLRDNDATSMAHSLELRVPLVDKAVFELAGRIDPTEKLAVNGGKRILRAAFADLLPEWIAKDRQKKTFTLPLMKWMREPMWKGRIMNTLTSQQCRERGWLNPRAVENHLHRYYASSLDDKRAWKLSQTVWLMFVLESWAQADAKA